MKSKIVILFYLLILMFMPNNILAYDTTGYIIDQYQLGSISGTTTSISQDSNNPNWQSITTGSSIYNISRIDIPLTGSTFAILNIYFSTTSSKDDAVVSERKVLDYPEVNRLITIEFSPVSISPSTVYYILFYVEEGVRLCYYNGANGYSGGRADTDVNYDYYFITYASRPLEETTPSTTTETETTTLFGATTTINHTQTIFEPTTETTTETSTFNQTITDSTTDTTTITTSDSTNYPYLSIIVMILIPLIYHKKKKNQ